MQDRIKLTTGYPAAANRSRIGSVCSSQPPHVPSENARAFVRALGRTDPAAADQIRIQAYPGLDHLGVTSGETPLTAAVDWLMKGEPAPGG